MLVRTHAHRHVGICVYVGMGVVGGWVGTFVENFCVYINIVCFESAVSILSMKCMHQGLI